MVAAGPTFGALYPPIWMTQTPLDSSRGVVHNRCSGVLSGCVLRLSSPPLALAGPGLASSRLHELIWRL